MASKGTCGACFRSMTLTGAGLVMRHGWSEVGGTRRVGQYGNVVHTGPCFGVGWAPYEVSPDCTTAFVNQVLFPMGVGVQATQARLATRPALIYSGKTWLRGEPGFAGSGGLTRNEWDGYAHWQVRLVDGDPETCGTKFYYFLPEDRETGGKFVPDTYNKIPSYEKFLASHVAQAQASWDAVAKDGLYCLKMVREWKPAAVKTVEKKLPLLHAARAAHAWLPQCRMSFGRGPTFRVTTDSSKVTCPKCKGYLAAAAVRATKTA